jgi:uncharacterized protein YkwD
MVAATDLRPRYSTGTRVVTGLAVCVLLASLLVALVAAPAHAQASAEEQQFMAVTNQARAAAGLPPLQDDQAAANVARSWAQSMASSGVLQHNPNLASQINSQVTTQWQRIGENIGYGPDVNSIQNAFLNSPPHKANILGDYNRVGIGTARDGSGRLWVTLDFVNGPPLMNSNPFGALDSVQRVPSGLQLTGWAADPDAPTQSIAAVAYVDGNGYSLGTASASRPDIAAGFSGYGNAHGYSGVVPAAPGWHQVCVYGLNVGPGSNNAVGCQTVLVDASPFGSLDSIQRVPGGLQLSGWAADWDSSSPISAAAYVDGNGYWLGSAAGSRPDIAAAFPAYGGSHGYGGVVPAGPGLHQVCVYGINVGAGANNAVGCRTVYVDASPFGSLDGVQRVPGGLQLSGWAADPDSSSPIATVAYVDGSGYWLGSATGSRPDIAAAFPAYGGNHAYGGVVPSGPGLHQVCVYGINAGPGANNAVGCRVILVDASPFGSLDAVQPVPGGLQVTGWTIDPDSASPITVHVYVDGIGFVIGAANANRPDVGAAFPDYGPSHGYQATLSVGHGTHTVCAYGINVGAGNNNGLGCQTVTN